MPRLDCRTYDSGGIQQAALPPVIRNYTSYPPADGMLFYNVRRAVTKVKCIADGAGAGNASIERTVEVDCKCKIQALRTIIKYLFSVLVDWP